MKKIFALTFTLLFSISLFAQQSLTLDEAIAIALQRNGNLIKSKNNLTSTEKNVKSAYGDLLPTLGAQGRWNWSREQNEGGLRQDYFGDFVEVPAETKQKRSYSLDIGGSFTLFDGLANIANISKSEDNLDAARLTLSNLKQTIVLQTKTYFYDVLKAKKLLDVRQENVKYNQKFLEQILEKNKLGSVAIADVYSQQVRSGQAELDLIQAQNSYELAVNTLLNYLALDVLEDYEIVDIDKQINLDQEKMYLSRLMAPAALVGEALKNRLDYKAQKFTLSGMGSSVTMAQGGLLPSITGSYGYGTGPYNTVDQLFNDNEISVSLTLSVPIFSNWNTENNIQFAKVQELNAREDLSALERQIKIEVKQGYLNVIAAKKGLDVAGKNVQAAGENRKVNNERYNLGSGTIIEVLNADQNFVEAQRQYITALFDYYTLKDQLNKHLGTLEFKSYE